MKKFHGDKVLFLMVCILMVFGLVMITSIGVPKSIELSAPDILYPNCSDPQVDCYLLLKSHFLRLLLGGVIMLVAAKIPYRFWKKISVVLFGLTVILLFFVLIAGSKYTTFAKSWLVLFDRFSLQPTEFAKLALIFYLANWFERKSSAVESFEYGFLPFCIITGAMMIPILLQPDLGGSLVTASVAVAIFYSAGAKLRHLALGGFVAFLAMLLLATANVSHVGDRFKAFLNLDTTGVQCSEKYCWQSKQANIAVGSGGFWGKGLTQGVQKSLWLPQAVDDFIFAASAEELGFVRIFLLVLIYGVIAWRGYTIALRASNRFAMLTAVGITTLIFFQAVINIAVNIALMPVTGITLPFVSYGGSSLISMLLATGILLNISQNSSDYAPDSKRRGNRRTYYPQYRSYS